MTPRTPRPRDPAPAPADPPALRRSQREAADAAQGPPENVPLLLVADDLGVSIDDLALVARDLEGFGK